MDRKSEETTDSAISYIILATPLKYFYSNKIGVEITRNKAYSCFFSNQKEIYFLLYLFHFPVTINGVTMLVSDLMSKKLITVELDDKLSVVKEIFENMKIHHLLVVEFKKVFGVVSDRDLYKALSPNIGTGTETYKDVATLNKRVHQIVSRHPTVLTPNAAIEEAIDIFNMHSFSCIPIVDCEMHPLGIITIRDIIKALAGRKIFIQNICN